MGLTIDLPSAGLLGISGAQAFQISSNTTLVENGIYVLEGSNNFTITLPAAPSIDGATILVKRTGSATITVAAVKIEGSVQSITITNNQPIRFTYVNAAIGYLIT
tara:strand:- start:20 stop:334 length:315 start_codon:yes stop_codon:yes gene_type:complete